MFSRDVLAIEVAKATYTIEQAIDAQVRGVLRRRGAVVGLSGGIDSSVVAALCTRALGKDKVLGLLMPEREVKTVTALRRRLINMQPHMQVEQLLAALKRFPTNAGLVEAAG